MKKNIFYFILAVSVLFTACKKNDGPIPKSIALDRQDVQPQVTKNASGSQAIDVLNLNNFSAVVNIGTYTSDVPVKMDVVVRKNNLNSSTKVVQAGLTTFPTSVTITAAQLEALFGVPVALNDAYDISVDYYTSDSKKYEAYPLIPGSPSVFGYGSGVSSQPGASLSVQYKAICAYDPAIYEGTFVLDSDDWADYYAGDLFTLTRVDDTHFTMIAENPIPENPVPLQVTVNPNDNSVSVAKQSVGSAWGYAGPGTYPAPFMLTAGSASSSFVSPCDQSVTFNFSYGYSAGTFSGTYPMVLHKQ